MKLKAICPAMLGIPGYSTLAPDGLHAFLRWDVASWLRAEKKINNSKTNKSLTYIPPNGKGGKSSAQKRPCKKDTVIVAMPTSSTTSEWWPPTNMQGSTQHLSDGHTRHILLLKVRSACIFVSKSIQQLQQTHWKTSSFEKVSWIFQSSPALNFYTICFLMIILVMPQLQTSFLIWLRGVVPVKHVRMCGLWSWSLMGKTILQLWQEKSHDMLLLLVPTKLQKMLERSGWFPCCGLCI